MWQTVYSFNNINIYKLTHEQNYTVSLLDRPETSPKLSELDQKLKQVYHMHGDAQPL